MVVRPICYICVKVLLNLKGIRYTVRVLNFVGKNFMFLVGKKVRGVLIFVAMAAW